MSQAVQNSQEVHGEAEHVGRAHRAKGALRLAVQPRGSALDLYRNFGRCLCSLPTESVTCV